MARWSDIVDFISTVDGYDSEGFPAPVPSERLNIFANKKDVRSSEFYQAASQGYRLETMFEVHSIDYEGEEDLRYDGEVYEIVRTYDRGEKVELVCQKRGEDHGP